ncbi:hypothetical protein MTO96_017865 [Rhipicephalus appendiculatus]
MLLRIVLRNSTEDTESVDYRTFAVASEEKYFQLRLANYSAREGWNAVGSLSGHNFSTYNRDNDAAAINCAARFRGGWWYENCLGGNLNGLNLNGHHGSMDDGIVWGMRYLDIGALYYSYPKVEMMIRPAE